MAQAVAVLLRSWARSSAAVRRTRLLCPASRRAIFDQTPRVRRPTGSTPSRGTETESSEENSMAIFDRNPTAFGRTTSAPAGYARTEVQVDQGLRAFMLGVYNN